jgi:hypothetical protein
MTKKFLIPLFIFLFLFPSLCFSSFDENKYFSEQWYFGKINFSQYIGWNFPRGEGVVVAVIDDGVWTQHPDLKNTAWTNTKETPGNNIDDDNNGYIDDYYGWNFIDNNHNLTTKGTHGTAVAGIIAAQDNYEGIVGIAPKVKIMPLIVCDSYGCDGNAIYDAIIYATKNGAHIINLSLASVNGYIGYTEKLNTAIEYANNNNVVVVAAAGNGDLESSNLSGAQAGMDLNFYNISPVNNDVKGYYSVLGVGASDKLSYRTNWSNYGKGVEIYAPGVEIISTVVPLYSDGYGYADLDGTSFSAPMVSAAAALLKSYTTYSSKEIIDRLINKSSKGILNIQDALEGVPLEKIRKESDSLSNNPTSNISLEISDNIATNLTIGSGSLENQSLNSTPKNGLLINQVKITASNDGKSEIKKITFKLEGSGSSDFIKNIYLKVNNNVISNSSVISGNILFNNLSLIINAGESKLLEVFLDIDSGASEGQYQVKLKSASDISTNGSVVSGLFPVSGKTINIVKGINIVEEEKKLLTNIDSRLSSRMKGKILLQVELNGEGWYVNPDNSKRYYLGRPDDAFQIMRELGLGISNKDFSSFNNFAPNRLSGKILLKVEDSGKAYYVNPVDLKMHYLGRPADAFQIMRELGLGISNENIRKIDIN